MKVTHSISNDESCPVVQLYGAHSCCCLLVLDEIWVVGGCASRLQPDILAIGIDVLWWHPQACEAPTGVVACLTVL